MSKFAIVKDGLVESIVISDIPLDPSWIELATNQECMIGWIHDFTDNTFRDPYVPPTDATPNITVTAATNQLNTGSNGLIHVFTKAVQTSITGTVQDIVAGVYNLPLFNTLDGDVKYAVFTVNPDKTYSFDFTVGYGVWMIDWGMFGTDVSTGDVTTNYITTTVTGEDLNMYLVGI